MSRPYTNSISYSGADTRVYAYYSSDPENVVLIDSIQTLSVSVYEPRGQVRALGYKGIKGLSGSVRSISGTMILVVIDDHPLRPLLNLLSPNAPIHSWSYDMDFNGTGTFSGREFKNRLSTLIPPFNILIEGVSEISEPTHGLIKEPVPIPSESYANKRNAAGSAADVDNRKRVTPPIRPAYGIASGVSELIVGVEIMSMGKVSSINDIMTEITVSFVARDYKPMSVWQILKGTEIENTEEKQHKNLEEEIRRMRTKEDFIFDPNDTSFDPDGSTGGGIV